MTGEGTLDDQYLEWLYSHVAATRNRNPSRSYWLLLKELYRTPFTWSIRNDDNRSGDGLDLRQEFMDECDVEDEDGFWTDLECSFLEMLIALSLRASFDSERTPVEWFWEMLQNMGIDKHTNKAFNNASRREVNEAVDRVINRTYSPDGRGGLFPLKSPHADQRTIELWYQMSSYLLEAEGYR